MTSDRVRGLRAPAGGTSRCTTVVPVASTSTAAFSLGLYAATGDLDVGRPRRCRVNRPAPRRAAPRARSSSYPCGHEHRVERRRVLTGVVGGRRCGREREGVVGGTTFRRRTSAASIPISAANRSTARSIAAVASDVRPSVGLDRGGVGHDDLRTSVAAVRQVVDALRHHPGKVGRNGRTAGYAPRWQDVELVRRTRPSRLPPMVNVCRGHARAPCTPGSRSASRSTAPGGRAVGPPRRPRGRPVDGTILAPKPPPTSGATTRTAPGSSPTAPATASRASCAFWVLAHTVSRPSAQRAAAARTSSGTGATRWFGKVRVDHDVTAAGTHRPGPGHRRNSPRWCRSPGTAGCGRPGRRPG